MAGTANAEPDVFPGQHVAHDFLHCPPDKSVMIKNQTPVKRPVKNRVDKVTEALLLLKNLPGFCNVPPFLHWNLETVTQIPVRLPGVAKHGGPAQQRGPHKINRHAVACGGYSHSTVGKNFRHFPALFILLRKRHIAGNKKVIGRIGRELRPRRAVDITVLQQAELLPAPAPQVGVKNPGRPDAISATAFDKQPDGDALLNVKHVFILAAVRGAFFFSAVAVQIQNVNFVKVLEQTLPHAAKSRVVNPGVVGDEAEDALTGLRNAPVGEAHKPHIIVIQPFRVALAEGRAIHGKIIGDRAPIVTAVEQFFNPLPLVCGMPRIRRIAEHHHHRLFLFDGVRLIGLAHNFMGKHRPGHRLLGFFQGVGQVNIEAAVFDRGGRVNAGFSQFHFHFQIADGVRRHQKLKAKQARQQMLAHIIRPAIPDPLVAHGAVNAVNHPA